MLLLQHLQSVHFRQPALGHLGQSEQPRVELRHRLDKAANWRWLRKRTLQDRRVTLLGVKNRVVPQFSPRGEGGLQLLLLPLLGLHKSRVARGELCKQRLQRVEPRPVEVPVPVRDAKLLELLLQRIQLLLVTRVLSLIFCVSFRLQNLLRPLRAQNRKHVQPPREAPRRSRSSVAAGKSGFAFFALPCKHSDRGRDELLEEVRVRNEPLPHKSQTLRLRQARLQFLPRKRRVDHANARAAVNLGASHSC